MIQDWFNTPQAQQTFAEYPLIKKGTPQYDQFTAQYGKDAWKDYNVNVLNYATQGNPGGMTFRKSGSLFGEVMKAAAPGLAAVFAPFALAALAPGAATAAVAPTGGGGFGTAAAVGGKMAGFDLGSILGSLGGFGGFKLPSMGGTPPFNPNAGGYPTGGGGFGLPGIFGGGGSGANMNGMGQYGAGIGLNSLAAFLQAGASNKTKMVPIPPPQPVFPGASAGLGAGIIPFGMQSFGTMTDMARTGMPVDYSNLFQTMVSANQRLNDIGRANLIEKYGSSGMRFSKPMADAAVTYENQTTKDFANILAQLAFSSQEAARARQMQAGSTGAGLFTSVGSTFAPSVLPVVGGQSPWGAAAGSGGNALQTFGLLKMMGVI
jgi:hypothetical protein